MPEDQEPAAENQPTAVEAAPSDVHDAVKQAIADQQPQPVTLNPCPCGETPEGLYIEMPERGKYGRASGQCCAEWGVEFKNNFEADGNKTMLKAAKAWNEAPRAA